MKFLVVAYSVLTFVISINAGGSPDWQTICLLPEDAGVACDGATPMEYYRYDPDFKFCTSFIYQGCGGNLNRFIDPEVCTSFCTRNIDGRPTGDGTFTGEDEI